MVAGLGRRLNVEEIMSALPLHLDVVSDVVCPWCYIGKRRLEGAIARADEVAVTVKWRPFFLNPWIPREGIDRDAYLTAKFGSVDRYKGIASNVAAAAAEEGLEYNVARISRQPNTIDCHRLIHWAEQVGQAGAMKQRLMDLYFREGADLTDPEVLIRAASDCGLDAEQVRQSLSSDLDVDLISQEAQAASDAGISGVPTFLLGGKYALSGAYPSHQLAKAIRHVASLALQQAS
jgi:predicted DsbA family dithiol-disulfide isomerase